MRQIKTQTKFDFKAQFSKKTWCFSSKRRENSKNNKKTSFNEGCYGIEFA